jgi:Xaa-Pro aminopeptidase
MNPRIKQVYKELNKLKLDGLILSHEPNISYLTNTRSRDAYLLVSKQKNIYITDSRYTTEAKKNLKGCTLLEIKGSVFKTIADACKKLHFNRVGFEERYLPFAEYNKIREGWDYGIELIPTHGIVEELRQIKTAEEIAKIRKAIEIAIAAFRFIQGYITPGRKEIEVAAELEHFIRYNGAYASSFDIIVASGPNSSYPHHLTSERKIKAGEPVLIDAGVDYLGFKSDLTRVFFSGKINSSARRIYDIVLAAQRRAISRIRPGVEISEVDAASRQYIAKKGFGRYFSHSLGHGIGLEVHEAPHISGKEKSLLKAGMVFTVEPAIYLPGRFGIRLEDICLVTRKGAEVISVTLDK